MVVDTTETDDDEPAPVERAKSFVRENKSDLLVGVTVAIGSAIVTRRMGR